MVNGPAATSIDKSSGSSVLIVSTVLKVPPINDDDVTNRDARNDFPDGLVP